MEWALTGVRVQQRGFGGLEAVVMERVWVAAEPVTVRAVYQDLAQQREIAYTTVMSTMDNLHRKGWLQRERVGKAYAYWAAVTREQRSADLMHAAWQTGGDPAVVLAHFLQQMDNQQDEMLRAAMRTAPRRQPS